MALTGSGGIGAVAGGISEALVTTAFGIGVAIIALWCFNLLNTKIEVYDAEMDNTTSQVIDFFIRTPKPSNTTKPRLLISLEKRGTQWVFQYP